MREEQIREIREKCIVANSEIGKVLERNGWKKCSECMGFGYLVDPTGDEASDCYTCAGSCKEETHEKRIIIGRPIRLADVLLAIAEEPSKYEAWIDATTFEDGSHFLLSIKGERMNFDKEILDWNLRADNLEEQSDETIAFIHSLLV